MSQGRFKLGWRLLALASVVLLITALSTPWIVGWVHRVRGTNRFTFDDPRGKIVKSAINPQTGLLFAGEAFEDTGLYITMMKVRPVHRLSKIESEATESPRSSWLGELFSPRFRRTPSTTLLEESRVIEVFAGWPVPFAERRGNVELVPRNYVRIEQVHYAALMKMRALMAQMQTPQAEGLRVHWPWMMMTILAWQSPVLLVLAWRAWVMVRGRRRLRLGCCAACNYAVAGLATCPECGTPVPAAAGSMNLAHN